MSLVRSAGPAPQGRRACPHDRAKRPGLATGKAARGGPRAPVPV